MTTIKRIREEFEEKTGEKGYSVDEFVRAATHFDGTLNTTTVRKYAAMNDLRVDLRDIEGLNLKGSKAKYFIPNSNLENLMEVMSVKTTLEEFQEELEFQRKKESPSIHRRGRNRKINRLY
jgi:hypothetical protein